VCREEYLNQWCRIKDMSEKTAKPMSGRQVIASSSSLLAAVWIVALASIPSAQSYRDQLASGTAADQIVTAYDAMTVIIPITMISSWVITSLWLKKLHIAATAINPSAMRLKRPWVFWSWIVPVVSLWFPKNIIEDLLKAEGSDEAKVIDRKRYFDLVAYLGWLCTGQQHWNCFRI
jgi:membrane-associated phospholipid phosphatase